MLKRLDLGNEPTMRLLDRYVAWIAKEASPAGGIGPHELSRLDDRHIADSLAMVEPINMATIKTVTDLGSGVGLPGIPLAVAFPRCRVTLLERSATRCRLLRRVVRLLALENVDVVQGDAFVDIPAADLIVSRAFIDPARLATITKPHREAGSVVVAAGSRVRPKEVGGWSIHAVGVDILDPPGWILIME